MLLAGFLLLLISAAYCSEEDVVELTDETFDEGIQKYDTVLVMFYAPWCGHCKQLKPEYAKAAGYLKDNDPPITLAKVDCTDSGKEVCNKHGVSGYPTLKIFRDGETMDYNGPRESSGIVKYMRTQVNPSSRELTTIGEVKDFIKQDEVGIIAFGESNSDMVATHSKVADKLKEKYRFGHSKVSPSELQGVEASGDTIILFRPKHLQSKFEPTYVVYDGPAKKDKVEFWINQNYHGLVGHRTRENSADFKNPLIVAYYDVDYVKNPKGTNYWRNRIFKVAANYAEDFTFAISPKGDFQHELNDFGFDFVKGDKPLVFARNEKGAKFSMKEEFTVENLEEFLRKLKSGELEPYLKSEPVPEDDGSPVVVAVAKNFDETVTNNNKDTLIEFYAPWCGHCKKLAPVYDQLAEEMKDEEIAIVKMDATANDVQEPYDVKGFPTLYWSPKNDKNNPIRYEGGRKVEDFIKYIAKHATEELKGWDRKGKERKEEL